MSHSRLPPPLPGNRRTDPVPHGIPFFAARDDEEVDVDGHQTVLGVVPADDRIDAVTPACGEEDEVRAVPAERQGEVGEALPDVTGGFLDGEPGAGPAGLEDSRYQSSSGGMPCARASSSTKQAVPESTDKPGARSARRVSGALDRSSEA